MLRWSACGGLRRGAGGGGLTPIGGGSGGAPTRGARFDESLAKGPDSVALDPSCWRDVSREITVC